MRISLSSTRIAIFEAIWLAFFAGEAISSFGQGLTPIAVYTEFSVLRQSPGPLGALHNRGVRYVELSSTNPIWERVDSSGRITGYIGEDNCARDGIGLCVLQDDVLTCFDENQVYFSGRVCKFGNADSLERLSPCDFMYEKINSYPQPSDFAGIQLKGTVWGNGSGWRTIILRNGALVGLARYSNCELNGPAFSFSRSKQSRPRLLAMHYAIAGEYLPFNLYFEERGLRLFRGRDDGMSRVGVEFNLTMRGKVVSEIHYKADGSHVVKVTHPWISRLFMKNLRGEGYWGLIRLLLPDDFKALPPHLWLVEDEWLNYGAGW